MDKMIVVTFRIDQNIWHQLKVKHGRKTSSIIREYILKELGLDDSE